MKKYIRTSTINPLDCSDAEQYDICCDPNTSPEILRAFAENVPTYSIKMALARNPSTPTDILDKLLKWERDISILGELVNNPNAPKDAYDRIGKDTRTKIYIAQLSYADPELLRKLADDGVEAVQFNVATNPNTPEDVRERLIHTVFGDYETNVVFDIKYTPTEIDAIANIIENTLNTTIYKDSMYDKRVEIGGDGRDTVILTTTWIPLYDRLDEICQLIADNLSNAGYVVTDWQYD